MGRIAGQKTKIDLAERIKKLPLYLFAEIDKMKRKALERGVDIINLGVGDPDQPTPRHIIDKLSEAAQDPKNHRYPSYEGLFEFREAVAKWYKRRFNVDLDPEREVLTLIGSKEGIGHLPLAFINPGDIALIPNPGYPVYNAGTIFAGGKPYFLPLLEENGFLPNLRAIDKEIAKKARLLFVNYPNNPTAAVAGKDFFTEVVEFALENNLIVCHDAAYSEIAFDGYKPPSFLEVEGAKEVGIEFHSLSKTYNMTGWRIGFVVGNADILAGLGSIKTNLDSGVFQAVQWAGVEALLGPEEEISKVSRIYQERRDSLVEGLNSLGWKIAKPKATFYVWARIPSGYTSTAFCTQLLEKTGIVATPGVGFGEYGEGYIRFALTVDKERMKEAIERIKGVRLESLT